MKYGFRTSSLKKRIAARTSSKRWVRHSLGLKAPKGWGWLTNPKRAAYNRAYYRRTKGCMVAMLLWLPALCAFVVIAFSLLIASAAGR